MLKNNMEAVSRYFDFEKDYAMMAAWWESHGSLPMRREHLSPTGILIEVDSAPVSIGFLYRTDSKICVFEWVVCDPDASKEARDLALNTLISEVIDHCKRGGFNLIYTSIGIPKYISRLKEQGFTPTATGQVHMFKEV